MTWNPVPPDPEPYRASYLPLRSDVYLVPRTAAHVSLALVAAMVAGLAGGLVALAVENTGLRFRADSAAAILSPCATDTECAALEELKGGRQ